MRTRWSAQSASARHLARCQVSNSAYTPPNYHLKAILDHSNLDTKLRVGIFSIQSSPAYHQYQTTQSGLHRYFIRLPPSDRRRARTYVLKRCLCFGARNTANPLRPKPSTGDEISFLHLFRDVKTHHHETTSKGISSLGL